MRLLRKKINFKNHIHRVQKKIKTLSSFFIKSGRSFKAVNLLNSLIFFYTQPSSKNKLKKKQLTFKNRNVFFAALQKKILQFKLRPRFINKRQKLIPSIINFKKANRLLMQRLSLICRKRNNRFLPSITAELEMLFANNPNSKIMKWRSDLLDVAEKNKVYIRRVRFKYSRIYLPKSKLVRRSPKAYALWRKKLFILKRKQKISLFANRLHIGPKNVSTVKLFKQRKQKFFRTASWRPLLKKTIIKLIDYEV